jgi:hypothetical protein
MGGEVSVAQYEFWVERFRKESCVTGGFLDASSAIRPLVKNVRSFCDVGRTIDN